MKTTTHYAKLQAMGFPPGSNHWGGLEIDTRYSEWRRRENRKMRAIVLFVAALGGLSLYLSMGGV